MKPLIICLALLVAGCGNLRVEWSMSYANDNVLADRAETQQLLKELGIEQDTVRGREEGSRPDSGHAEPLAVEAGESADHQTD